MVRTNPERRRALLDAAIEVLAQRGARGLTFRGVDEEAGVPVGTASNYFTNRDDLFVQVGHRYYERLTPDAQTIAAAREPQTRESLVDVMTEVVERVASFRTGYLAILELRLEATRRPELQALLTERVRADMEYNVDNYRSTGLPGGADSVTLLHLALNWLILERLTLPGVVDADRAAELVRLAVERAVPGE
ncbi:TetR/AcrR family transcriptional regulator [Rhodococcus rhodnii]|uniref:TetR family transcriptional regulator n=2 Tax=Rhodococcus rhodnii TaxID=38312 RepID=R7WQG7_9NOCA|nr:TetR/AcrR family transcriptional regulator [Rhodococcus rhodnii]EOM77515.1 TetR family transcriptional regulator [Rhodococcus rhodnii LMG 5362]TXG90379.1 TetR/AcrR family transcriptional regulator [Rhodococcus rhodnii]